MIPLSVPNIAGNEWQYVKDCLDTNWISSVGSYVDRFEQMLAEFTGVPYAVACVNGTSALHISMLLAGVQPEDYVIVPNITFVASVNSIRYCFAKPILMDVDAESWQMDLDLLESFLAEQTFQENGSLYLKADRKRIGAIMPVHVLGNMVDMDRFMDIVSRYPLPVVEDSTEALGSYYKGKHAGSMGLFGCFSFNGNKIISTGGGGMIVTHDQALAKRAKHITTTAKSDPFEYMHDETGYNYRLVNVLAAVGVAQMEQLPGFIQRKQEIAQAYYDGLSGVGDVRFQKVTEGVNPNQWLFTIKTARQREVLAHLNANKFQSRPFWVPMNQLPMYKDDLFIQHNNTSQSIYETCLSIPCSTNITDEEVQTVIRTIREVFAS